MFGSLAICCFLLSHLNYFNLFGIS
uniref:Uncharacterized protein n=1 Tax=Rhizophora mucronata TaxID=61149 RepID=A0A2P2Q006_RHIMU